MNVLYGRKDLGFKVEKEAIINGEDLLLISEYNKIMECTIYQILYNCGGIELTTVYKEVAKEKFNELFNEMIKKFH